MPNPFGTDAMATGCASFRPPLHPLIMERVKPYLPERGKVSRTLDVGCGAGLSTNALQGLAEYRLGLDPSESMVRLVPGTAPGADFVVARAEAIPVRAQCIDVIFAAGSLNYANPPLFFRGSGAYFESGRNSCDLQFLAGENIQGFRRTR